MTRRLAVAVLNPPRWTPPGVDKHEWRVALAEDVLAVFATLAEVEAAVAVRDSESALPTEIGWPGLTRYPLAALDVATVFAAAARDGYDQAALIAADAPDLPGMLIATLLRPLATCPLAASVVAGGAAGEKTSGSVGRAGRTGRGSAPGLVGLAARLPAPTWLPAAGLDQLSLSALRATAPRSGQVAAGLSWHRLRAATDLLRLDLRLEGWDATRELLLG